jgi:hypothetical protein
VPAIQEMERAFVKEARHQIGWSSPYLHPQDLLALREELEAGATREAMESAFQDLLVDKGETSPSILHFLLNRLGALGSRTAVPYALHQLLERPEETESILRYLGATGINHEDVSQVVGYLVSEEATYEFQRFQILRWLCEQDPVPCCEDVLAFARGLVRNRSEPLWLRSHAIAVMGQCGDRADLEALEGLYESSTGELESTIIVCALARLHKARRNAFYGRAAGDGFLVAAATRWAKGQTSSATPGI